MLFRSERDDPATAAADRPARANGKPPGKPGLQPRRWWLLFVVIAIVNIVVTRVFFPEPAALAVSYTFFKQQVEAGNVASVTSAGDALHGRFRTAVTYPPSPAAAGGTAPAAARDPARTSTKFKTQRPVFADPGLEALLERHGVVIEATDESRPSWFSILISFGPTLLLIAAFVWVSRRAAAGGGMLGLGRSRAKRYSADQPQVTFDDVAGIDEAENELIEIVDFLKNPAKYQRLGGTVPKGVQIGRAHV